MTNADGGRIFDNPCPHCPLHVRGSHPIEASGKSDADKISHPDFQTVEASGNRPSALRCAGFSGSVLVDQIERALDQKDSAYATLVRMANKDIAKLQAENAELNRDVDRLKDLLGRDVCALFNKAKEKIASLETQLEMAEERRQIQNQKWGKEIEEQCRLNGMGSQREAALLGKVDSLQSTINHLEKELAEQKDEVGRLHQKHKKRCIEINELSMALSEEKSRNSRHCICPGCMATPPPATEEKP